MQQLAIIQPAKCVQQIHRCIWHFEAAFLYFIYGTVNQIIRLVARVILFTYRDFSWFNLKQKCCLCETTFIITMAATMKSSNCPCTIHTDCIYCSTVLMHFQPFYWISTACCNIQSIMFSSSQSLNNVPAILFPILQLYFNVQDYVGENAQCS